MEFFSIIEGGTGSRKMNEISMTSPIARNEINKSKNDVQPCLKTMKEQHSFDDHYTG